MNKYLNLLLILFLTVAGCTQEKTRKITTPSVVVYKAKTADVDDFNTIIGQVVAYDDVYLYARVEGFLEKQHFHDGAYVKKGEILFEIQKEQYSAEVSLAKAALIKSKDYLWNAKIEYERNKYLAGTKAVSQRDYDKAVSTYTQGQADVTSAEANLALAELNLSYTTIKAPFAGQVGIAPYRPGNLVGPTSKPLIRVIKIDPMWVEVALPEENFIEYMVKTYPGKKMPDMKRRTTKVKDLYATLILSNGTEYAHKGAINFLDNKIDAATGTYQMRALFANPKGILLPGEFVNVKIVKEKKITVTLIPQAALQQNQLGKYVLTVDKKNKVRSKHVTTGKPYGDYIIAVSGVNPGELLIIEGVQKVHEGIKVNPVLAKNIKYNM
ncbi:MAG TPA: efflux RND transporter periplasmic adaptor subunit [Victivallales bacterium]|nr:efflux RND transporter periplasmic adaptor subunit [Victivallales bacterium]